MDPIVIVIIIAVCLPIGVVLGLAKASRMRGPIYRPESKRPVGTLVTEAVPDEHPDDELDPDPGPTFEINSEPPEPDPGLRPNP